MLAYIDQVDGEKYPGVAGKIESQIEALRASGFVCEHIHLPYRRSLWIQLLRRLPLMPDWYCWEIIDLERYDCFYIRRPYFISPSFIIFLKKLKKSNPKAKVIVEFPSYPYDGEMMGLSCYPLLLRDRFYRRFIHRYIDRIAGYSVPDTVFDTPTLSIKNGIAVDQIKVRTFNSEDCTIHILFLAMFATWHGADRIITGLADYYNSTYNKRKVILHLVGEGPESQELHRLVRDNDLETKVIFHGIMSSEEYEPLFDKCSAAVASIGMHRIGLTYASTLKTREYLARGIPFVYSGVIDVFESTPVDFCLQIPADDSAVDIENMICFFERLYKENSSNELAKRIHDYAKRTVDINAVFRPVVLFYNS